MGVLTRIKQRRSRVLDGVRTRLWPVPAMGVLAAVCAGVAIPELDEAFDERLPVSVSAYLFGGGSDAARDVLSAIASSLITVTSLTFSLTVVTLQLASQQFSPRLLRTFARDRFVQLTLAVFLSTFVYALTVLRTVRDSTDDGQAQFVPKLAVTVAYLMAVVSVVGLVLFLGHLVRQIRVETLLDTVAGDARQSILATTEAAEGDAVPAPAAPASALALTAPSTGFLCAVDPDSLVAAAAAQDVVIEISECPGNWLVEGTPLGRVWPRLHRPLTDEARESVHRCLTEATTIGLERTSIQDVRYGVRQLTDVAVKALSPSINDPTTGVYTLGHLSAVLCDLVDRDLDDVVRCDGDGEARVILARPAFGLLLDLAISQPRRYGAAETAVQAAVLRLLHDVAWRTSVPAHRASVAHQLSRTRASVAQQDFDATDRQDLERLALRVEHVLAGQS